MAIEENIELLDELVRTLNTEPSWMVLGDFADVSQDVFRELAFDPEFTDRVVGILTEFRNEIGSIGVTGREPNTENAERFFDYLIRHIEDERYDQAEALASQMPGYVSGKIPAEAAKYTATCEPVYPNTGRLAEHRSAITEATSGGVPVDTFVYEEGEVACAILKTIVDDD